MWLSRLIVDLHFERFVSHGFEVFLPLQNGQMVVNRDKLFGQS